LRRYNNNKLYRKGHLQGMSTLSTMSTIQPRKGHEHEYFQRAKAVNVSWATKEQVRAMPKDVPWSQGVGKAYTLSAKVDGFDRSVVISTWKNSKPFLYPNFANSNSRPPLSISGDLDRLTPYVSQDGRNIDSTREHVTAYNRERESSKAGAERADAAGSRGLISGVVDDECTQDESRHTMDAFIQTINGFSLGEAQHPQDLETFLEEFDT
jgi:hypothetical protein